METVKLSEEMWTGIRPRLQYDLDLVEIKIITLEIRLKGFTLKLQNHWNTLSTLNGTLKKLENIGKPKEISENETKDTRILKLQSNVFRLTDEVDELLVKVLVDLPVALRTEQAKRSTLKKLLENGPPEFLFSGNT